MTAPKKRRVVPKKVTKRVRKGTMTAKDLAIEYLADGMAAVERALAAGKVTKAGVRRAYDVLLGRGTEAKPLEELVGKLFQGAVGHKGRAAPEVGTERDYSAQRLGHGTPFLRLPLNTLGVEKGSPIRVRFERDRLVVVKVEVKQAQAA